MRHSHGIFSLLLALLYAGSFLGCSSSDDGSSLATDPGEDARTIGELEDDGVEADTAIPDMGIPDDAEIETDDAAVDAGPRPACQDGEDNDDDGLVDYPEDPGCERPADDDEFNEPERPECDDGIDNDGDGLLDLADSDCSASDDPTEAGADPIGVCNDGVDNDDDGLADFPDDPGCQSAGDTTEDDPAVAPVCANGVDDDDDGLVDFPYDPGCAGRGDLDETDPEHPAACSDGVDNDDSGQTDFPADPGCDFSADRDELSPCGADIPVIDLSGHLDANAAYDGTLIDAPTHLVGTCGGAAGGEFIFAYRVDRPLERVVFSTVHDETEAPVVMYLRRPCLTPGDLACDRGTVDAPGTTLVLEHPAPGIYLLVVDTGSRQDVGAFRLTAEAVGPPACRDSADNDGDGLVDRADPGCTDSEDTDEGNPETPPVCSDGVDNDGDGDADYPNDPDCVFAGGDREEPLCDLDVPWLRVSQRGGELELPHQEAQGQAVSSCEINGGAETVLVVTLDEPSDVFVEVLEADGTVAHANLYARTDCVSTQTEIGCHVSGEDGPLTLAGLDRGVYFVFVEQGASAPGRTARVVVISNIRACNDLEDNDGDGRTDLADPGCETGMDDSEVDPPEPPECSDGVDNDEDGDVDWPDDESCVAAGDPDEAPLCELQPVVAAFGQGGGEVQLNTVGQADAYQGTCGGSGPEQVVSVTLTRPSNLTFEIVAASYDTLIFMRAGLCDDPAAEAACNDDGGAGLWSRISLNNAAPGTYFVFVDGFGGSSGTSTLRVTVQ